MSRPKKPTLASGPARTLGKQSQLSDNSRAIIARTRAAIELITAVIGDTTVVGVGVVLGPKRIKPRAGKFED